MAFDVYIQTSTSEKNKMDKSISTITTVSGVLKEDCSIVDPVILIKADITTLIHANYMTIPAFGRSYFMHPPKSVNGGFVEISGHCDVLSSFKSQIRANTALVRNSERNWNLYLNDGTFQTYQNPYVYTKKFSAGFPTSNDTYILAVAGS